MTEKYFLYALDHLGADCNEIYFHPAAYDPGGQLDDEQKQSLAELEALLSGTVRLRIGSLGIRLTNYLELENAK
jgi:hypothetical protein